MEGMRKQAIDAVKPYKGGNDSLWRLHQLNLADKHRFLITVGSQLWSIDLGGYGFRRMLEQLDPDNPMGERLAELLRTNPPHAFFRAAVDGWSPHQAGDEVFRGLAEDEPDEDLVLRGGPLRGRLGGRLSRRGRRPCRPAASGPRGCGAR